jgi:hypothetical protein
MRLISARGSDDIQVRLKARFTEFNRSSSPSQGRKYPVELQALVRQASSEGIELSTLGQLTGASPTALARWCKAAEVAPARRLTKPLKVRRLEVVRPDVDKRTSSIVVRLPSGVSIEFADGAVLGADLLTSLATLGGSHAASR